MFYYKNSDKFSIRYNINILREIERIISIILKMSIRQIHTFKIQIPTKIKYTLKYIQFLSFHQDSSLIISINETIIIIIKNNHKFLLLFEIKFTVSLMLIYQTQNTVERSTNSSKSQNYIFRLPSNFIYIIIQPIHIEYIYM